MKFHDYITEADLFGFRYASSSATEIASFYGRVEEAVFAKFGDVSPSIRYNLAAEFDWLTSERPYYKVWPDYIDMLCNTSLKIKPSMFQFPYRAFAVRFPVGHEPVFSALKVHSFLFSQVECKEMCTNIPKIVTFTSAAVYNSLTGDRQKYYRGFGMPEGVTYAEFLAKAQHRVDSSSQMDSVPIVRDESAIDPMMDALLRLAISVAFLSTGGERYMDPDILNEDFKKYLAAVNAGNSVEAERLKQKARTTYGRPGNVLGRREHLLGQRSYRVAKDDGRDLVAGQERKYRHIRNAHIHRYWKMVDGTKQLVPQFQPMVVVRPDLPPDPRAKGYRTLRTKKEMES